MKSEYRRFVKVQGVGEYVDYDVPTKDEYDDYRDKVNQCFERLYAKVEALEKETEKESPKVEKSEVYTATLFSIVGSTLELTGTKEQHQVFDKSREIIDESLFPRFLTWDKLVKLALDCGLSVKEIKITNYNCNID